MVNRSGIGTKRSNAPLTETKFTVTGAKDSGKPKGGKNKGKSKPKKGGKKKVKKVKD